MLRELLSVAALFASISPWSAQALAQTPLGTAWTYQGQLKDAGSPVEGTYDLRFRLYDAALGGVQLGSLVCIDNVAVADGLFAVSLDFGAQFAGQQTFLEVDVRGDTGLNCGNSAGFVTLGPRQALTAAPNAMFSLNAGTLDGLDSTSFLQSIPNPLSLSGSSSGVPIISGTNTSTNSDSSGVFGRSTAANGITYGGYFRSDSAAGTGVLGQATAGGGTTYGGWFKSASTSGYGVQGWANAGSGSTCGGYFRSDSTSGCGVFGLANAGSGSTYGGYFQSDSPTGRAVFGLAYADNGVNYGGRFQSASTEGRGVHGWATAGSGTTYGGYFQADSAGGYGVFGRGGYYGGRFEGTTSIGRGVYGYVPETIGTTYGVYGQSESTSGRGVYGYASATGASDAPYGVRGFCSTATSGYAVYAAGDMGASGVKSFRIDHPSDPESKYLLHYATESPEVLNFYRGTLVLDERGEAVVELPEYFASINKTPSYQLTAIGAPMPNLHVAEEISEQALLAGEQAGPGARPPACSFHIGGGVPGAKVSWEVKAVRNDLRMRRHEAPVEREKTGPERGKYQHPEYYGQPPEMGMDAETALPSSPTEEPSNSETKKVRK